MATPNSQVPVLAQSQTPAQARFTPYRKTPRSRRIHRNPPAVEARHTVQRNVLNEAELGKLLAGHTWQMYRVTPLYAFSYRKKHLRQYERELGAYFDAESNKGVGVEHRVEERVDNATITVIKGLKQEHDRHAIQIQLKAKPARADSDEKKVVLTAVLCSVNLLSEQASRVHDQFVALPLLLTKGPVAHCRLLTSWLQSQFDCRINQLKLSAHSLVWVVALWAGIVTKKVSVELLYKVPAVVPGVRTITLNIDPQDCQRLWNKIHKDDSDEFQAEEVLQFMKALEKHFHRHFRIHLRCLQLSRIGTGVAMLASSGKLKIMSADHVITTLSHLTELAAEMVIY